MSLKVFVSSTKDDLDKDCRPRVLEVIAKAEVVPIAMENWPSRYKPALELVLEQIDGSTHYLGLFAYRRGWTPPGTTVSITEAEFEHARTRLPQEHVAVFIPAEGSPIARKLKKYAKDGQDEADAQAQAAFLARVRNNGTVESFRDVPELAMITMRCVMSWKTPLIDRAGAAPARAASSVAVPGPDDVAELGRRAQEDCFETDLLDRLAGPGAPPAAGVLVSGPAGHGHAQLLGRLRRRFEAVSRRTHPCTVGCGPLWRKGGLQSLLRVLARETGAAELATMDAAAAHVASLLAQKDVVLQVTALQNFEGGVDGFVDQFWGPLVAALPAATPYRLLCLASHEGRTPDPPAWDATTQPCRAAPWDARRLVRLAPLEPFTAAELSLFLRARLDPDQADTMVTALMETTGGTPGLLYDALTDPANWPS
jgi:hypothetical protein